jgi:tRNA pseudouridine13 synthase
LATLEARNWETHGLVDAIATRLGLPEGRIHFSGTKDRRAVTVQRMAIPAPEDRVRSLDLPRLTVRETRRADRAPKLGELHGNRFRVRVRELDVPVDEARERAEAVLEVLDDAGIPNYYGIQRFGSVRPVSHVVGRHILEGDLEAAVLTYVGATHEREPDRTRRPRERFQEEMDPRAAIDDFPRSLSFERDMLQALVRDPEDWTGALGTLPTNLVQMLVYAYQSYLYNRILSRRLDSDLDLVEPAVGDVVLPADEHGVADKDDPVDVTERNQAIVARTCARDRGVASGLVFGTDVAFAGGAMGSIEEEVAGEAGIDRDAFHVYAVPDVDAPGTRRGLRAPVADLDVATGDDERGPFLELSFFLPKGCYATGLLREVMKADDVRSY